MEKKIVVLNYSGHGSATGDDTILKNTNWTFSILLNVDDSGGHTGVLSQWLTSLDEYGDILAEEFGIKNWEKYNLPIGDFKTILSRWLGQKYHKNGEKISKLLSKRIAVENGKMEDLEKIRKNFQELIKLSGLEKETFKVNIFLKSYLNFVKKGEFLAYVQTGNLENRNIYCHSIGNIFLQFLMFLKGEDFFKFLKIIGWIPKHVNFYFIHPTRLILQGQYRLQNLKTNKIISEKDIDNSIFPLDNLYYVNPKNGKKFRGFYKKIHDLIKNSDAVLSFAGSPANRMPIFEHLQKNLRQYPHKIIVVANAFQAAMDQPIYMQIQNIFEMGIRPIVLAPRENPFNFILDNKLAYKHLQAYILEGKTPFNCRNFEIWLKNFAYKKNIKMILKMQINQGLKYYPEQINELIKSILK